MKKSTSIRLFLILAVLLCGSAYAIGYYYSVYQWEKRMVREPLKTEQQLSENSRDVNLTPVATAPYQFVLSQQDGYIIVYYADQETVYSITDIPVKSLSIRLQQEIGQGKFIYSEEELYNFLESHSS